jgi:predicted nucleotidyltransferase component of viral defense system
MIGYLQSLGLSINVGDLESYKQRKLYLISKILEKINSYPCGSNYVLKGGTALLLCYKLDRFSEDIDLDGIKSVSLENAVEDGCRESGFSCTVNKTKDTSTVLRYMIDFQEAAEEDRYPLKIEASFRNSELLSKNIYIPESPNGIRVYGLKRLISMKFSAFRNRHAIRDFYDVCWMVKEYPHLIGSQLATEMWEQLQYKDFNLLVEELVEVAYGDHIMRSTNIEYLALEMLDKLPELMKEV